MATFATKGRVRPASTSAGHADYGFFGPDSVTWRVWLYPTSLTVGFQRAVTIEELDPFLLAAVYTTDKVAAHPRRRYDGTMRYFATVAFGDSRSAVKASEMLVKLHAHYGVGVEPISGLRYDANDPDQQLWIHLTAWHSILYAYERFGPGKLDDEDERRYWQECAIAAELQTIDPARVPRSRDQVREYFESERPRLAASEATQAMMRHILGSLYDVLAEPFPRALAPVAWIASTLVRTATLATMPRWQRELAGVRQWRLVDAAIGPVMRFAFWAFTRSTRVQLYALGILSPATVAVIAPILRAVPPQTLETLTPAEAFERHQTPTPAAVYAALRQPEADLRGTYDVPWPHGASITVSRLAVTAAADAADVGMAR
jgi:uncharacterized protein (DUF2236 family)